MSGSQPLSPATTVTGALRQQIAAAMSLLDAVELSTASATVQAATLAVRRSLSQASEECARLRAAVVAEQAAARIGQPGLFTDG